MNVRIGTAYFADLVQTLRRRRAGAGRPTMPANTACRAGSPSGPASSRDEFIDDIPFPETQNYVKRILGTAEDYRRCTRSGWRGHGSGTRPAAGRQLDGTAKSRARLTLAIASVIRYRNPWPLTSRPRTSRKPRGSPSRSSAR